MSLSWSPSDGVIRRLFSAALVVALALTVVVIVPGSVPAARADRPPSDYILIFANAAGTAAGTAADERFEGSVDSNDVAVTVRGVTMTIHLSCSELFNLYTAKGSDGGLKARDGTNPSWGYGEELGHSPVEEETEPRLWDFSIFHPGHQGGSICGFSRDGGLPGIDIEKATNGDDADTETGPSITVDDTVTWTYVVTNTGDFPLSNIVVTDDNGTPGDSSDDFNVTCPESSLADSESMTCTATGTATLGQYANNGTVTGEHDQTTVSDTDPSHYLGVTAENQCPFGPETDRIFIDIIGETGGFLWGAPNKSPNQLGPIAAVVPAGTYRVSWASWDEHSEHGGQNQTQEQWYLDVGGAISVDTEDVPEDQNFIQGVLGTDLVVGSPATSVTIHHGGQPDTTNSVFAICAALDPLVPGIDIEKSTNGTDADTPTGPSITVGDPVTWTYVVTNTGHVDLTGIVVTDDHGVTPVYQSGDTGDDQILGLGEAWIYKATGTAVLGQYANVGTATDNNGDGPTVTDTDPSHYVGVTTPPPPTPGIDIEKSTNGFDSDTAPGESITVDAAVTWTYTVTNNGEVVLTNVIVTDNVLGDVCTIGVLLVGATETCTVTGVAVAGQYANVGTARDTASNVTDSDNSHYFGQEVAASATIGDTVWSDENENGVQDNGEKGISAATVRLTLPDASTVQVNTNANGLYLFSGLEAGTYKAELILGSIPKPTEGDLKLTTAGSFTIDLADDGTYLDADFGVVATLPKTGIETDQIALIGLVLLAAGTLAVLVTRRRQDDLGEGDIAA